MKLPYYKRLKIFFRELMESLGDADTLEAQSKAILMENDIRDEEFTDEVK
jgi:exoribonuclease R